MPPDVALGLMMNISTANAWKTVPVLQGLGISFGGKHALHQFMPSLMGQKPSIRDRIAASFDQRSNAWPSA